MRALLIYIVLLYYYSLPGQGVGINETGAPSFPGAILDVSSDSKGVLLPRTTSESITQPSEGMVIYDTIAQEFKYYNGVQWLALLVENAYSFWWADMDGDGFGYPFNVIYTPSPPEYYVGNNDDCDDSNPGIYSASPEYCDDDIDNNCDGQIDCPEGEFCCDSVCTELGTDVDNCGMCGVSCDDGIACTDDSCVQGVCIHAVQPGMCVIGGVCYTDGDHNPLNYCEVCDANNPLGWSAYCDAPLICCGQECVDLGTDVDNCGMCGVSCDDGIACTNDICVQGACVHIIQSGNCLIDGVCYLNGEQNPEMECLICNTDISQTQWSFAPSGTPCNNGNGTCDGEGNCD